MPIEVILNVYDLIEQTPICCGFFHTGVAIMGTEYAFAGGAGVYDCVPRMAHDGRFRQSIVLGTVESSSVARSALDRLRSEFHPDAYSVVFRNCNDFSSAYSRALLGRDIPGWINRLAHLGRMWPIHCFLPAHMKGAAGAGAPTQTPLLTQPQMVFQGEGRCLGDPGGGGSGLFAPSLCGLRRFGGGGLLARVSRALGLRREQPGHTSSDALIQGDDARELRAMAATRRLGNGRGGADLEAGGDAGAAAGASGSGRAGDPMPNPWR